MATVALFVPLFLVGDRLIWRSTYVAAAFVMVVYAAVLAALLSTFGRYRAEQRITLAQWRRAPYVTGLLLLLAFSVLPLATWPIGFSGINLHLRNAVLCSLGLNVTAAILVWFGSGWHRLGLTVVAYWVSFLWLFPLAIRG